VGAPLGTLVAMRRIRQPSSRTLPADGANPQEPLEGLWDAFAEELAEGIAEDEYL
jgi:hypothetical protein